MRKKHVKTVYFTINQTQHIKFLNQRMIIMTENNENSNNMKAYSVRLDKQTHDFIKGMSDAVSYQTGAPSNFSSTLRFLLKRQSNLNIKPSFAKLNDNDVQYINNFVNYMQATMDQFLQAEQGVGVNINQLAYLANSKQLNVVDQKYLDDLHVQHNQMMNDLDQIMTSLKQIKMILNLETLAQDSAKLQANAQAQNQTQHSSPQTQAGDQNASDTHN